MYSLFTFKPYYNLHLGVSKLVKQCMVKYLSSDGLVAGGPVKGRKPFLKIRERILRGCNLLLETIEGDGELPGT